MKTKILIIALIAITFSSKAQEWKSTGSNATAGVLTMDGSYFKLIIPTTSGSWARGFNNIATDKTTRIGGVGLFGTGDIPNYYYMAHGTSPWNSRLGIYVKTNGYTGIGTYNPKHRLSLKGNFSIGVSETTDNQWGEFVLKKNNASINYASLGFTQGTSTNNKNISEALIIQRTGNIGIGTTTPDKKLTVQNDIKILKSGNARTKGDKAQLIFGEKNADHYSGIIKVENTNSNPGFVNPKMSFILQDNNSHTSDKLKERMVILPNGNIGIGITNPKAKLDVNGSLQITGSKGANNQTFANLNFFNNYDKTNAILAQIQGVRGDNSFQKGNLSFTVKNGTELVEAIRIKSNGNIGIGTTTFPSTYKLAVAGKVITEEIKVQLQSNWSDFVFEKNYKLPTLVEVENHIKEKGHLKDIPSAKEVKKDGFFLGEMDAKLLQKIEELTLYTIKQNKEIKELKEQTKEIKLLKQQNSKIEKLEKENQVLKSLLERVSQLEKQMNKK